MYYIRAFNPTGPTVNVDAATTAPAGLQASASGTLQAEQYRIYNAGTTVVFVAHGVDATEATANAVIPTGGGANAKNSHPVAPSTAIIISAPINTFWSAIIASGTAEVYVTPGKGIA